ncbi:hypothetical protein [Alicycliphilus denitrificans]|uniref:hypothetical protein n=1 Tax=Alicycliphilus denitrificans TaxID=179636 RepID=UPI0001D9FE86|nr:hypothetical protein [Alicycliphilus denitrificans]ADU99452.1 hypothetical protein Alide_1697 [Alicycliphilus denitrificans BC]
MIVVNTLTGAVSEYTRHDFQSITPTHGGSATGLYAFDGDTDNGLPIVSEIRLPATLRESTLKQSIQMAYLSMRGDGSACFTVHGAREVWRYSFPLRPSEQTRCPVGRGIRENYLGFGLSNPAGQAFTLDRVEILAAASKSRRV